MNDDDRGPAPRAGWSFTFPIFSTDWLEAIRAWWHERQRQNLIEREWRRR